MFIINEVKFPLWNGMTKQLTNSEFVFTIKIYFFTILWAQDQSLFEVKQQNTLFNKES